MKELSVFKIFPQALVLAFCLFAQLFAGGLTIENVGLVNRDTANNTFDVKFDISWAQSWRITGAPSADANWDAAWVFVKYSVYSGGALGDWGHCKLLNTGYVIPTGSQVSFGATGASYVGFFIYRNAAGTGTVDWNNVRVKWDYGSNGVADDAIVQVQVFALEMVYVPQGSFYVGDADNDRINCFFTSDGSYTANEIGLPPYQITSESEITVGTQSGNLYYDEDYAGDGDGAGPVPAAFPKGFNAFYCMKYELAQGQYAAFLNTLTSAQQAKRYKDTTSHRYYLEVQNGDYGCDANGNNILDQSNDGQWNACNFIRWMDAAAYTDWAGLRPMTELEFEKACRGGQAVADDEYAWGSASVTAVSYTISNDNQANAVISNPQNGMGNAMYVTTRGALLGPMKFGIFGGSLVSPSREEAGASYFGIMELSGNLWESCVSIGSAKGRSFAGSQGDGVLTTTVTYEGNATNTDWPGIDGTYVRGVTGATGSSLRGGTWTYATEHLCVSSRLLATFTSSQSFSDVGFRCVRTAP